MSKTNMLLFFKSLCIFSFLIITNTSRANEASQSIPTLLKQMDHLLQEREIFVTQKEHKLDSLKHQLALSKSLDDKYKLSTKLIEEYKSYICDSALKYIDNSWEIAMLTKENNRLNEVKLQKANLLTTIGLYHETFDILDDIHANELPSELLKQYYHCCEQAYYHMSNYASNSFYENVYKQKCQLYIDSLLNIPLARDNGRIRLLARKLYYEGNGKKAQELLRNVLKSHTFGTHGYAIITATLSGMVSSDEEKKKLLLLSAMSDIMSAVKENTSLRKLAVELFKEGDIERAYHYCNISMSDANFYNARLRSLEIAQIQPIIENAYQQEIKKQQRRLKVCLIAITILFCTLTVFSRLLQKQNKKLNIVKMKLQQSNRELSELNESLLTLNASLSESNKVKEEYVNRFMSLCASNIANLKQYQSVIYSKILTNKIGELKTLVNSTEFIEIEVKQFYQNFDEAFLNIYPNFIIEFNQLLKTEERISLPQGKKLPPELRIFALIRLGITDTEKIAKFLQYSINTVYSYRTKIKNKAINKADFDTKISIIG